MLRVQIDGQTLTYMHDGIPGGRAIVEKDPLTADTGLHHINIYLPYNTPVEYATELVAEAVKMMRILNNQ